VWLYCHDVASLAWRYWFEGGRPSRFAHLIGLRRFLETEVLDADDEVRARFTAFASALDLADAARHKTDAVIQEHLVMSVVRLGSFITLPRVRGDETNATLRSIADIAQGTDSVLHLTAAAAALKETYKLQRSRDFPQGSSDTFTQDVLIALNRCVGALVHEVANARMTLLELSEFVVLLEQEAGHGSERVAN
jgi:hypothetical protein